MRRRGAIAWVVLMLAGAAWHPAHAADEIAFGITSKTAFSLAHYVATEKKYYEAENLKVGEIVVGAAVGVLLQLAAGSLNVAQAATDQTLRRVAKPPRRKKSASATAVQGRKRRRIRKVSYASTDQKAHR